MKKIFLLVLLNLQNIYAQNEINFEVDMNHINQPNNTDYTSVVINGSWNNWVGWGVQLLITMMMVWTGQLVLDENINSFEYVIAITGPTDNFSDGGNSLVKVVMKITLILYLKTTLIFMTKHQY